MMIWEIWDCIHTHTHTHPRMHTHVRTHNCNWSLLVTAGGWESFLERAGRTEICTSWGRRLNMWVLKHEYCFDQKRLWRGHITLCFSIRFVVFFLAGNSFHWHLDNGLWLWIEVLFSHKLETRGQVESRHCDLLVQKSHEVRWTQACEYLRQTVFSFLKIAYFSCTYLSPTDTLRTVRTGLMWTWDDPHLCLIAKLAIAILKCSNTHTLKKASHRSPDNQTISSHSTGFQWQWVFLFCLSVRMLRIHDIIHFNSVCGLKLEEAKYPKYDHAAL